MTHDEIVTLLQIIHHYDSRVIDSTAVAVWSESARRARWSFAEAVEAVHEHNAHSTDYLKPAHVTDRIRLTRRQPAPVAELRALDPAPPASAERRAEVMAKIRELADKKSVDRA